MLYCMYIFFYCVVMLLIDVNTLNIQCDQQTQPITPSMNQIIICDNNCDLCEIHCGNINQCFGAIIYSGALNTTIKCTGENACAQSKIYIGKTGNYPINYNHINFQRNSYLSVNIDCTGKVGCARSTIIIDGSFSSNNLVLNADAGGQDSFKDATIDVATYPGQSFNLICGSEQPNCAGTTYICRGGGCLCNSNIIANNGGCIGILQGIVDKSRSPTLSPTKNPTVIPTKNPTINPTLLTLIPTSSPTIVTLSPSMFPTKLTVNPTINPTELPTVSPTKPTSVPTGITQLPTYLPTINPSNNPTFNPTNNPSDTPTVNPTLFPTKSTINPTILPSISPTINPTEIPTVNPSYNPTMTPSVSPTPLSQSPTIPTINPTINPTNTPSNNPSISTVSPTVLPTKETLLPTNQPTKLTDLPSSSPTITPTLIPSLSPSITPTMTTLLPSNTPTLSTSSPTPKNITELLNKQKTREKIINMIRVISIIIGLILAIIGIHFCNIKLRRCKEDQNDMADVIQTQISNNTVQMNTNKLYGKPNYPSKIHVKPSNSIDSPKNENNLGVTPGQTILVRKNSDDGIEVTYERNN